MVTIFIYKKQTIIHQQCYTTSKKMEINAAKETFIYFRKNASFYKCVAKGKKVVCRALFRQKMHMKLVEEDY